jgi:hypothetical protein
MKTGFLALVTAALAVGLAVPTAPAADSPFAPGVRIVETRGVVRPGGTVRARVVRERRGDGGADGRVAVRWILRAGDGTILDHGRRRFEVSGGRPSVFPVRARVPSGAEPWTTATLEVAVERNLVNFDAARTRVRIAPGRFVRARPSIVEVREGVLGTGSTGFPLIEAEAEGAPGPFHLVGPVVAEILRHPDWPGARVRVEGRRVGLTGIAYFPEDEPHFLRARLVEWLDPPPERLEATGATTGDFGPPAPRGAYDDEASFAAYVESTRRPMVAESVEEMDALRAEFGHRIDGLPPVDFATHRVVVVTAGLCPDSAYAAALGEAWYDARTGRTTVVGDAIELPFPLAYAVITRPWVAAVLPRRPGPVEFRRREWVGDLPGWWPPVPPY